MILLLNNTNEEGRQMFMIGLNSIEYVHIPMDVLVEELSKINYATWWKILYTVDIVMLGYKEYCVLWEI